MPRTEIPVDPSPEIVALPGSEIERLLCLGRNGALDDLQVAAPDAWAMQLPGLAAFVDWPDDAPRPTICIATEQIAGPVRNGGIGNTYAALALMLAEAGFDVTVLYLRGSKVETHTIEHWVEDYAQKGVTLVAVPNYAAREKLQTGADRWLHAPYNMMRWLIDHPMDVVHVSEWRGSAYLCLLAKRQGLAFAETLFLVKTSSPWMWNRMYGAHMIEKTDDLAKVEAERQSVELADVVIGGSLHLLRWMASQGYRLPRARIFVQPNVVTFARLAPLMAGRPAAGGTRVPINEIVFFGRLELRKGLFVFCQSIRRLIRKGVALPPKITFMGKPGGRMPSHPDLEAPDYLRMISADWPTQVEILTEFQQLDAVHYLLSGPRLAVMPSIIENSSMAVYEASICGIPCIASDVGGNAELIVPQDHAEVLCKPHPVSLGDRLEEALAKGGYVPRPSFDNHDNLAVWERFHRQLGGALRVELLAQTRPVAPAATTSSQTSVCVYCTGESLALDATLASLAKQSCPPHEVLLGIDAENGDIVATAAMTAAAHGVAVRVIEAYDLDAGGGFDLLARAATGEYVHFLWEGATLVPDALATLQHAARSSGADLLTYFHRVSQGAGPEFGALRALVLGSVADHFFRDDTCELPLFMRHAAYLRLGGFTEDYRVVGHDHELVMRAMVAGVHCETVLRELGSIRDRSPDWMRKAGYDVAACYFRAVRPLLSAAPLALRDMLLHARGIAMRSTITRRVQAADLRTSEPRAIAMQIPPGVQPADPGGSNAEVSLPAVPMPAPPPTWSDRLARLLAQGSVQQDGAVVGQFLGLYQARLYGWACDLGAPAQPVELELTVDGTASLILARQRFAKTANVPPEAMRSGFILDLPPQYYRSKDGLQLSLVVAGSGLVLADGVAVPSGVTLENCGISGACEANDAGMLSGWACYHENPDQFVELALYCEGAFLSHVQANLDHPKAAKAGWGFRYDIPKALRAGGKVQIDVVIAETGVALRHSPVTVDGQRVIVNRWPNIWRMGK